MTNVLWVEDQVSENREYIEDVEARGGRVTTAATVAEALAALASVTFQAVVLDLNIPLGLDSAVEGLPDGDLNGLHVLEWIKATGLLGSIRVVCLTNFHDTARRAVEGYGVTMLKKSVFMETLTSSVLGE